MLDKQLKHISALWSSNTISRQIIEVCFCVCYPESVKKNLSVLEELLTACKKDARGIQWRYITTDIQKRHEFSKQAKNKIKTDLKSIKVATANQSDVTLLSSTFKKFAAPKITLEFSNSTFSERSDETDKLEIKTDFEGIQKFVEKYFPKRKEHLITVPDFDQINARSCIRNRDFFSLLQRNEKVSFWTK